MEADFSGYATKAGLKCSDGRTIMPNAFEHQDQMTVPLVWQHGHDNPENVLGHAILENRSDGVYAYAFFNDTAKADHAKSLVKHGDISRLSIWANELVERAGRVIHGAIREVSLVLAGANPGAVIENVTIRHSDGDTMLSDEVIIHSGTELDADTIFEFFPVDDDGQELSHDDLDDDEDSDEDEESDEEPVEDEEEEDDSEEDEDSEDSVEHSDDPDADDLLHEDSDKETIGDVYETLSDKQKEVVHYLIGEALQGKPVEHDNLDGESADDSDDSDTLSHNTDTDQEGKDMTGTRNVFESDESQAPALSHSQMEGIMADARKTGSMKEAVENYALAHGIDNIGVLFPDAVAVDKMPEFLKRRTEWVASFLGATRKSPFSRIKTLNADLTMEEARAKGYVTGAMKKEEFFGVSQRVTVPTTVYKKQKLDRDDMVDITDFDVVVWLKGEMRMMLDEEIARAALIGDGRDVAHEDKINEGNIRPIASDHDLFTTTVNCPVTLGGVGSAQIVIDQIIRNRKHLKGTGQPTFFTTESWISEFLLLKDSVGRRIYRNLEELASELRVSAIVPVEVMEEETSLIGVIVNPADYVMGSTAGGEVTMFDDFDIDYNQYKYLIETRLCGALVKLKSALRIEAVAEGDTLVAPAPPVFDPEAGANGQVTITDTVGVTYKDAEGTTITNSGGPYNVTVDEAYTVTAEANAGYYFSNNAEDEWTFFVRS